MEECADLLDQKAEQFGLSKKGEKFNNFAVGGRPYASEDPWTVKPRSVYVRMLKSDRSYDMAHMG